MFIKNDPVLTEILRKNGHLFLPVVPFDPKKDRLLLMDFTSANPELGAGLAGGFEGLGVYVEEQLQRSGCRYGIGGYDENRTVYSMSRVFDDAVEPRRLHLGIDIWGKAGTPVYVPIGGMIHSFAFNDRVGDYGATIILKHQLQTAVFHTLYGHVSVSDLGKLREGQYLNQGQLLAHIGTPSDNGNWPPHLHFQLIRDMHMKRGDYPGVCKWSDREKYISNSPDPDLVLQMMKYARKEPVTP